MPRITPAWVLPAEVNTATWFTQTIRLNIPIASAAMVSVAAPLMPWSLGFAAGAMLFIISDEIIPETHRGGFQNLATFALLGGFALMMFLDATLG